MADHIQVGDAVPRVQYAANGSQTAFTFTFPIFTATDMEVWVGSVKQAATAYSISGVGISGGGTVLFAVPPVKDAVVTLRRQMVITRTGDYQEDGIIRAKVLNDEFDYQTAALQQVAEDTNRAVKRSFLSSDTADLTLPDPSAGKAIKWNATATGLENSIADADLVLAAATAQATAAAASQVSANSSASAASASASGASASASSAHASELSALGSASSATASANAAALSAANAQTSETNAATSATDSHASETNATTSAISASASASTASAAATSASASASSATTSASAAAGSSDSASASASSAAASASSAQTYASQAQAAASGGAVKISATDTIGNFLQTKLVAGTNIALTRTNPGANEVLSVGVTGLGTAAALAADTDPILAANSDGNVPTQKAIKAFVAAQVASAASASDITNLQQDVMQLYLMDSVNGALAAGQYVNGGFDAFTSDMIGANSTGQTYDGANKLYSNQAWTSTGTWSLPLATARGISSALGRFGGMSFTAPVSGAIGSIKINVGSVIIADSYSAAVWSNSAGSPGMQIGSASGSVSITTAGDVTFTFGAPPAMTASTVYWIVISPSGAGEVALTTTVTSASYGSGRNNMITSLTGGSLPSAEEWQMLISSPIANMALVSSALTPAPASAPTQVKLMVLWKGLSGSAVVNTDFTAEATRDGATWTAGTLTDTGLTISGFKVLWSVVNVSAQPSGTTVKYRLKTLNAKSQQVKGVALMTK